MSAISYMQNMIIAGTLEVQSELVPDIFIITIGYEVDCLKQFVKIFERFHISMRFYLRR